MNNGPTAAPARFPYVEHRTMAEVLRAERQAKAKKPGPKPVIDWRHIAFVRDQIEAGKSYSDIGAHFGVSDRTVSCFARRNGIGRNHGRPQAWPDCPDHLREQYRRLRKNYGYRSDEARALLEGRAA